VGDKNPEAVAKRVLEMAIPGARMVFRPEQSHGEYDYDLHYPNGEVAAVEVTSSRNQALTQIHSEIFGKKRGGSGISAIRCTKTWYIFPAVDADIKTTRQNADEYLADLEAAGVESFDLSDCWRNGSPECVLKICRDLRLTRGDVIRSSGVPQIRIGGVVSGGAVGPTSATEAGEKEAEANREKLGRASTKERHLVVYVDQQHGQPFTALTSFDPPAKLPKLPAEITHMWLVTEMGKDQFVVWRGSSTEQWHKVDL